MTDPSTPDPTCSKCGHAKSAHFHLRQQPEWEGCCKECIPKKCYFAPSSPGAPEGPWVIWFEDAGVKPELFAGPFAEEAARRCFADRQVNWACHLLGPASPASPGATPVGERDIRVAPSDPGDWTEDFAHENGQYQCKCRTCGQLFIGHKRRVTCRVCASPASLAEAAGEPEERRTWVIIYEDQDIKPLFYNGTEHDARVILAQQEESWACHLFVAASPSPGATPVGEREPTDFDAADIRVEAAKRELRRAIRQHRKAFDPDAAMRAVMECEAELLHAAKELGRIVALAASPSSGAGQLSEADALRNELGAAKATLDRMTTDALAWSGYIHEFCKRLGVRGPEGGANVAEVALCKLDALLRAAPASSGPRVTEDTERLDWLDKALRAPQFGELGYGADISITGWGASVVIAHGARSINTPGDAEHNDGGRTLREAIDAARKGGSDA